MTAQIVRKCHPNALWTKEIGTIRDASDVQKNFVRRVFPKQC